MEEKALQELEGALRAATPAPWSSLACFLYGASGRDIGQAGDADAAAIAALRNSAPSLLSDSRALLEARKLLQSALDHLYETHSCSSDVPQEIAAFLSGEPPAGPSSPLDPGEQK